MQKNENQCNKMQKHANNMQNMKQALQKISSEPVRLIMLERMASQSSGLTEHFGELNASPHISSADLKDILQETFFLIL